MTSGIRTAASIIVSSFALALAGIVLLAAGGRPGWAAAIWAAFAVNVVLGVLTVGALSASIGRSDKVFMSVAGGGPILRLGLLGLSFYLWSRVWPGTLPVLVIASVVFCLVCLIAEVAYAAQGLGDRDATWTDGDQSAARRGSSPRRLHGERGPAELAL